MKKVAIIIANYNKSRWIKDCIDSVLLQTYENFEIIIVDDCSTDDSVNIIKNNYQGNNKVHLYVLDKNKGVQYARNYGVSLTDAEYVVFLDSDDIYINSNKIRNEVEISNKNTIAYSQWVPMDVNGKIKRYKKYIKNPYETKYAICKILSMSQPSYKMLRGYMVSKRLFNKVGGYCFPYNMYEDFDYQCRLCINGRIVYTGEVGEAYRIGTNGLSARNLKMANKSIDIIQSTYFNRLDITQKIIYIVLKISHDLFMIPIKLFKKIYVMVKKEIYK